jgi:hypothetical protein
MLQWLYTYVSKVRSKYFISFRHMLQAFYLNVADACFESFICFTRMLQFFAKVDLDVDVEEAQALGGPAATAPLVWQR